MLKKVNMLFGFEEEYQKIIKYPKYNSLFEKHNHLKYSIEKITWIFFTRQKKGQFKDSSEKYKW